MKNLRELAESYDLQYVETTSEGNGYPSNIKGAIIGFETFEQAQELAEENDLEVVMFTKKDGWQLWTRGNTTHGPMTISASDYGDDFSEFSNSISEFEFIKDEVMPFFDPDNGEVSSFESIEKIISEKKEVWEEIEVLGDNEIVITHLGQYFETVEEKTMHFTHDTNNWAIGVQDKTL